MAISRCIGVGATAFGTWAATVVATALAASTASGQTQPPKAEAPPRAELLCAADQPLVHPGESVVVRAWVVGAPDEPAARRWQWQSALGSVQGGEVATWRFVPGELPKEGNTVTATVEAASAGDTAQTLRCDVDILLADRPEPSAGDARGNTAQAFLLEGQAPPTGYGMYSYLLLTKPGGEIEMRRNINAVAMYLTTLPAMARMRLLVSENQLNLALLPLMRTVALPRELMDTDEALALAAQVVKIYDYERAQKLLLDFCVQAQAGGPFLVGSRDRDGCRQSRLLLDLTQTLPDLVPYWIRTFSSLAAAERSWGKDTMTELLLKTRNIIATSYRGAAAGAQDLSRSLRMLDSRH